MKGTMDGAGGVRKPKVENQAEGNGEATGSPPPVATAGWGDPREASFAVAGNGTARAPDCTWPSKGSQQELALTGLCG